jgi:hypothetical protein
MFSEAVIKFYKELEIKGSLQKQVYLPLVF